MDLRLHFSCHLTSGVIFVKKHALKPFGLQVSGFRGPILRVDQKKKRR